MSWRRRDREDDLDREMRAHLELEAEERGNGPDGALAPGAARYAARRAFGNLTAVKETIHEMSKWSVMKQFAQDLRYARLLRRSPAFSIVAVLTWRWELGRIPPSSAS
ncbi:MAG TPA: hypothetical protein VMR62_24295 [Bryobacteraceae bacterium]|jgi:hypothetical protein|nr:hypothetical protein [Bryobacteraceae bacterium]